MKHQILTFIILLGLSVNYVSAQTLANGFRFLEDKEYEKSQKIFEDILKSKPTDVDAMFGLGEVYFETGKTDLAKEMYSKGIATKETAVNIAGMGKVALRNGQQAEAEAYFKDAMKKAKKDGRAAVSIARHHYNQGHLDKAVQYADLAIGADSKSASAYFLKGLIGLKNRNASDATLQFDRVLYFDPSRLEAYLYQAEILELARNPQKAVELLNKAIAIDPQYGKTYKQLAETYYNRGRYNEAIPHFEKYFQLVPEDKDKSHYAYSLFFTKQYDKATEVITALYNSDPNNYVLVRLLGYIGMETKDTDKAKTYLEQLFKLTPPDKLLNDDYLYYGRMLAATGNDSEAVIHFEKAAAMDSTNVLVYDDLAKSYRRLNDFDKYIAYSKKFFMNKPDVLSTDYYYLGQAIYTAAQSTLDTDSIKGVSLYMEADSMFQQVEIKSPTSYLGTFWRARCQWGIDKDMSLGLANPLYTKALEMILDDSSKNKEKVEIYGYLGYYHYLKNEKEPSIENWRKLLEIDPEHATAKEALGELTK